MSPYLAELKERGIHTLYMPSAYTSNSKIVPTTSLSKSTSSGDIRIRFDRDILADGVGFIKKGEGFVAATGGCSINAISTPKGLIVFHGGRESWINRIDVLFWHIAHQRLSSTMQGHVLEQALTFMAEEGIPPERSSFHTFGSIAGTRFQHPRDVKDEEHRAYNNNLEPYLDHVIPGVSAIEMHDGVQCLNMREIIMGKARAARFSNVKNGFDLPSYDQGGYVDTRLQDETLRKKRNLILVFSPQ